MFGFDLESGASESLATAPAPAPALRAETAALVGRMASPPSRARRQAIDRLIAALVDVDLWDRLDALVILAAHDAQAALLNWKGAVHTSSIGGGAPVFTADRGFWCDGLDDWIDTGFAPSAGVRFQQNSAMAGAWFRKGERNANSPVGTVTASAVTINPRGASDASASRLNGSGAVNGGMVATGYGFTAVDRASSTTLQQYAGGRALGAAASATSSSRSGVTIGLGRANNAFAEGQFCAFVAGASLSPAQHAALFTALDAYMAEVGVAALPSPAVRTLPLAAAYTLPDGSAPASPGKGMAATGLVRMPDGRWYVGNGLATRRALLFSRMSADLGAVEAEFTSAGLGLGSDFDGSCQGMTLDASDGTIWFILKLAGAGGATTYLCHFDPATEAMVGSPIAISPSDTGVAYDPVIDELWITRDTGANAGQLVLYSKAGTALTAAIPTPGGTDQCAYRAETGELLVTAGANGANGTVCVYARGDYGGMALRRMDTLAGADAIEGVAAALGAIFVCNDAATHPGDPVLNRVLGYVA